MKIKLKIDLIFKAFIHIFSVLIPLEFVKVCVHIT